MTCTTLKDLGITRRASLALGVGLSFEMLGIGNSFSQSIGARKLVVVLCRGAMDGLSVSPPIGDPRYAVLRGEIAIPKEKSLKLDGDFGLHPNLLNLYRLAQKGQARIAPAVAMPQRSRSHFEAQDLLESGSSRLYDAATGWLNRTLQAIGSERKARAISVGWQKPKILQGPMDADCWAPSGRIPPDTSRVASILQELYREDSVLENALDSGLRLQAEATRIGADELVSNDVKDLVAGASQFLSDPEGPSIAVLSLDGFDTHAHQGGVTGHLANRLVVLDELIAGIELGMGSKWQDTVVLVATEFGRTVRVNGSKGTDHGTASTLILAGGAISPGPIIGDWPTLAEGRLFEKRDLAPTLDIRQIFKGILIDHMAVSKQAIEALVFPNSEAAAPIRGLII
jgi:uncharacterized protein (DUF1501 family)